MHGTEQSAVFASKVPFDENRIRAAALYCSDGRWGEQFDDFLHNALQLPRYDRLAVPGGAACLAGHFLAHREEEGLIEQLRFLVKAHGLERVVLVAHQDCAFYSEKLHVSPLQIEMRQREDVQAAIQRIRWLAPGLLVNAFLARKDQGGTIQFASMEHAE
jgi:hypothetical protein